MYEKTFDEMARLCEDLGVLIVSFDGYGPYDEIRVMCIDEVVSPLWRANYVRHNIDGGFVYGGASNCVYEEDAETALALVLQRAFDFDSIEDVYETTFNVNAMKKVYDSSRAELCYGSEAWNAFDYGYAEEVF